MVLALAIITLYLIFLVVISVIPKGEGFLWRTHKYGRSDLWVHFFAYLLLLIFSFFTFKEVFRVLNRYTILLISVLFAGAIGGANELLQYYVPGRNPGMDDFFADLYGIGCGVFIVLLIWIEKRFRITKSM